MRSEPVARTTVVLSDVHARLEKLEALLETIGVLRDGVRQPGFHVIQLGDLVNLGYGVPERAFLEQAWDWIDVKVIGNHELPVVWWDPRRVRFQGWEDRDEDAAAFVRRTAKEGQWRAAASVGDWLVTHAGLSAYHWRESFGSEQDAATLAAAIDRRFWHAVERRAPADVFEGIGAARRLRDPHEHPGIFWADIGELAPDYADGAFPLRQIVGHTPTGGPKQHGERLWCIDTPELVPGTWGGVAALVTRDAGASFELVWER